MPHRLEGANLGKTGAGGRACRMDWKEEKIGVFKGFSLVLVILGWGVSWGR